MLNPVNQSNIFLVKGFLNTKDFLNKFRYSMGLAHFWLHLTLKGKSWYGFCQFGIFRIKIIFKPIS
jgi:hypothetical protein